MRNDVVNSCLNGQALFEYSKEKMTTNQSVISAHAFWYFLLDS